MEKQELIRNIFAVFPTTMRKLMWPMNCTQMPKQQLVLLHCIRHHDNMPMRFYSDKLMISKPNMTVLADKLIEAGMVERYAEADDRRRINLRTTAAGREYADRTFQQVYDMMIKRFENVEEGVLLRMSKLITELAEIVDQLENTKEE